jgi:hypothetical protein
VPEAKPAGGTFKAAAVSETAEGETEQAVSLMTVQEITQLAESEIIGVHRNLRPFSGKPHGIHFRSSKPEGQGSTTVLTTVKRWGFAMLSYASAWL